MGRCERAQRRRAQPPTAELVLKRGPGPRHDLAPLLRPAAAAEAQAAVAGAAETQLLPTPAARAQLVRLSAHPTLSAVEVYDRRVIEIVSANAGCTEAALAAAQAKLGHALPADYVAFLRLHDGAKLPVCWIPDLPPPGASARCIFPLAEARRSCRFVRKPGTTRWPFGEDGSGNYVVLVRRWWRWRVAFWDHETEDLTDLAGSFTEFLSLLEPLDLSTLPDVSGATVWINPNPLKPPPQLWDDEDSS